MDTPKKSELRGLLMALKRDIRDEYRASDDPDDHLPGMQVTIGWNEDGDWSWQTGDNSYTGGAYGYPHWAVISLYRRSNCKDLAEDIIDQLKEVSQ